MSNGTIEPLQSVPGTVVVAGSQVSPGGEQGPIGSTGAAGPPGPAGPATTTTANFTVPPIGSTAVVSVSDTSWIIIGEFVWVATAGGDVNTPMALQVKAKTSTTLTLLNPPTGVLSPSGDANNQIILGSDGLLYLPPSAIQPTIWYSRLRNFNSIGNPTFEVDQRNIGNTVANPGNNSYVIDRWQHQQAGTMVVSAGQQAALAGINIPGTNFSITRGFYRVTLTTQQASLAAGDQLTIVQNIEGPQWRELQNDVHSFQILVRTSVAGLKFGVTLLDPSRSYTLSNLLTIPTANVWTLLTLPNLPIWTPLGNFSPSSGINGYLLKICLAGGTGQTVASNGSWIASGNFAAVGQDNFASKAVGSTFDIAFIQHEPGSLCSQLIDKPFISNLDECLRYYQKTYPYATAIGSTNANGSVIVTIGANQNSWVVVRFPKLMAKNPTVVGYSTGTGAINNVRNANTAADIVINSVVSPGDSGYGGFNLATPPTAAAGIQWHHTADTAW